MVETVRHGVDGTGAAAAAMGASEARQRMTLRQRMTHSTETRGDPRRGRNGRLTRALPNPIGGGGGRRTGHDDASGGKAARREGASRKGNVNLGVDAAHGDRI